MYQPYVYRITNTVTGEFYHGSRTAKVMNKRTPQEDLWVHYFTHSKEVKDQRAIYGDDSFRAEVVQAYNDADETFWAEQHLIKQSIQSDFCLNGHYVDPDTQTRKFSRAGIEWSADQRKQISVRNTGKRKSEETKQKLSDSHKGKTKSDEHLRNLAQAVKGRKMPPCSEKFKKEQSDRLKGRPGKKHTEETKAKMSASRLGHSTSDETRKKISETKAKNKVNRTK